MLHTYATDSRKDWDKLLPYLLFAYQEVPQASTGFAPFERLCGHPVRNPLDILKVEWEAEERVCSIVCVVIEGATGEHGRVCTRGPAQGPEGPEGLV